MTRNALDFFILGYARSGTSLLRMILNGHPHIKVNPECSFITFLYDSFKDAQYPLSESEVGHFVERVINSRKFHTWNISSFEILSAIKKLRPLNYGHLCSIIYQLHSPGKDFRYLGDKNNVNIFHRDILEEIYPDSKFIYIVRDPRDVYISLLDIQTSKIKSQYAPLTPSSVNEYCDQWMRAYNPVINSQAKNSEKEILIHYEDLVKMPNATIASVLNFIDPSLVNSISEFDLAVLHLFGNDEPEELLDWKKKTLEPISTRSSGRWKLDLSKIDAIEIAKSTQEALHFFNYER